MLLAEASDPGELSRIIVPGLGMGIRRPINLGWHPDVAISSTCKNNAVNQCTSTCADIGECIFGCEIGGINNVDTCNVSCTSLGDPCLDSCLSTVTTINACTPLAVLSFSVVVGSTVYPLNGSSPAILPWEVTAIQVVFSEPVTVASIASLGGISATGLSGIGTNTLTWTIPPTPIANVTVTLPGTGVNGLQDASGNTLSPNGYTYSNGIAYSQTLKILWGDVNGDGVVNASDMVLDNTATTKPYNILYDANGDGVVNSSDVFAVKARLNTKLPTP